MVKIPGQDSFTGVCYHFFLTAAAVDVTVVNMVRFVVSACMPQSAVARVLRRVYYCGQQRHLRNDVEYTQRSVDCGFGHQLSFTPSWPQELLCCLYTTSACHALTLREAGHSLECHITTTASRCLGLLLIASRFSSVIVYPIARESRYPWRRGAEMAAHVVLH